ncbi:JAM1 protein, partial [Atractosteus spatula]|nr:JAM1 protein [Atractosteus spatula]
MATLLDSNPRKRAIDFNMVTLAIVFVFSAVQAESSNGDKHHMSEGAVNTDKQPGRDLSPPGRTVGAALPYRLLLCLTLPSLFSFREVNLCAVPDTGKCCSVCRAHSGSGSPPPVNHKRGRRVSAGTASGLSVTTSTSVVQVPENSGADLNCQYSADFVNPRVEWKYKDKSGSQAFLFYDGKPTAKYGDRIQLLPNGLRFAKVTRQDNGEYTCEVSSKEGFASTKVQLIVQGSEVTLTCFDEDGSPPSTYKWYNGSTLLPENPQQFPAFANSSYILNPKDGTLVSVCNSLL